MNLGLTTGKYENMTDTNKLLYLIYGEVKRIREVFDGANIDPLVSVKALDNVEVQPEPDNPTTGQIEATQLKEGRNCKYCAEFIEGNKGDYLAHVRKCPKRTEGK